MALDEPFTRQLRGKLRELRFHVEREQLRITYFIAPGRGSFLAGDAGVCMTDHLEEVQ